MKYELEVIAFNIASCKIAQESGADRIELCANPHEGGTTPSYGMIAESRKATSIQLFPIIRPRGGDFLYTNHEFQSMLHDIEICKKLNCDGVVMGMLDADGNIDMDRSSKLMEAASSMQVTFHRAFDRVKDPLNALEQIISLGCKRILTSGLKPTVIEGANYLSKLVEAASDRIKIMPGSGVRAENIIQLAKATGAKSFHSSARKMVESTMNYSNLQMNESLQLVSLDGDEVRKIKNNLDAHFNK